MLIGLKHCQEGKNNGSVLWLFLSPYYGKLTYCKDKSINISEKSNLNVLLTNKHKMTLEMWHILKAIWGRWGNNINTQQFLSVYDKAFLNASN